MMLCQPMRRFTVTANLSGVSPMMLDCLNCLAVFGYVFSDSLIVSEIVAHAIPRENFGRDEARAHIPAVITQDELIKTGLPRGPIFLRRNQNRFARCALGPAKDKGVNAVAFEHLDIRQLARSFFHHDSGESASGKASGKQNNKEKFKAHKDQVETVNRVLVLSNPTRQQFPTARI
jgi:hypothetical protein